jgi:ribosome-associated protein
MDPGLRRDGGRRNAVMTGEDRSATTASYADPMHESIDFELHGEHVELNQLLKLAGVCDSGGAGKQLVASGAVRVDGAVELRKTCKIRAGQVVRVGGIEIAVRGG